MGACYSGLGSKATAPIDGPIDPKIKEINCENKSNKVFDCDLLSTSFENLSFDKTIDNKIIKTSMSSQPSRQKIPIPSSKVVPKGSQELVYSKYKTRRYEAAVDVNKVMIFDNSSTTSISSDCSIHLSKSSKSTSSSASNIARPLTSIPKPVKSRTPTPPIPVRLQSRKGNQSHQYIDKTQNNPLISDRLNGNQVLKNDNKINKTKSVFNDSNTCPPKPSYGPTCGTSIKYTTQVSGLPRPQTAHIVSTSSHNTDNAVNHKMNASNDVTTRLKQLSDNKNRNIKCDQNLRQLKPYYYGMNNKPYERPNSFNYNRLQYQFQHPNQPKIAFIPSSNDSQNNQNPNPIAPNDALKPKPESTHCQTVKRDEPFIKSIVSENKNQNIVKNSIKSQALDKSGNENTFLPKSIQRVRELAPLFARKDIKPINSDKSEGIDDKSVETSIESNSIISVSANSETENKDLQYFDDEISDQPELVLNSNIDKKGLMKNLNEELEGLKLESSGSPPTSSPSKVLPTHLTSSIVSPNTTTFRKPRPLSLVEMPDGSYGLDSPSFRAASQDLIGIKTLLFRLQGLLQNAETLNPFEHNYSQNKFYQHLMFAENDGIESKDNNWDDLETENLDLKRQIVLQQKLIEDKDRTIRLLQHQMAKYSDFNNTFNSEDKKVEKVNACSQTDRCRNASNINPRAVSDGSNGMLVSVCCSHGFDEDN